jgi:hypothetical protein
MEQAVCAMQGDRRGWTALSMNNFHVYSLVFW